MRKHQSPIQQELLRRRSSQIAQASSTAPPSVPSPAPSPAGNSANALQRRSSVSPAATDFVHQSATSYDTKMRRRKALIVGIGYRNHKHLSPLPGCLNDVCEMFNLLTGDMFGFDQRDVKVLCDEISTIGHVRVQQPTRINILLEMNWLTQGIVAGDSVIFFFAGHGESVHDVSGDEIETGIDQCIMPIDYMRIVEPVHKAGKIRFKGVEPILDDTIYERLVRSVPDGAKITAIIDACKSGTVCDLPVIYDKDGLPRYRNGEHRPPREALRPYFYAGGCVLFSGSADHQMSADMTITVRSGENGAPARESFGIMTRSFGDAVREMVATREADYDGIESWTYGQLLSRVREMVRERAQMHLPEYFEKQEPQLSSSHAFDIWNTRFSI